ncbi:MAG: acetate--CoA ligase family protein [Omnitrophica WOR_2 bacterium]
MSESTLRPFFAPRGIVVVGASRDSTKLGYGLARNLVQSNYQGVIHFVNPKGGSLMGRTIHPSLALVPDPVDLAILLIPATAVPLSIKACGERGIPAVIIGSGGFRETGPEGAALEAECLQVARAYGIRLMGPNCIGLLDTHLPLDATFLPPPGPTPGDVAFISHSGAICAAVIDWARGQGFGLSRLVSLGNQVDVNETDVLDPVASDTFTHVLTLYLEGVSDGRRFVREASRLSRLKPIIAIKVGRFASGQRAVASHTGALAGSESAFNAAFHKAGVIRADTSEEMFDWARTLAWCPLPAGRRVAVLTNAGGPGVTASDALEAHGLHLAHLQEETCRALQDKLPPAASLHNPIDMLASASPEQFAACLSILLDDPGVDSVLVILPPPPMYTAGAVAKAIIPIVHNNDKPVVVALMGERLIQEAIEHFRAARVPEYRFPERAASALAVLAQRAEYLRRCASADAEPEHAAENPDRLKELVHKLLKAVHPGFLDQDVARDILQAYDIPVPPQVLAHSVEEAVRHSVQMGFPVALKIASPDIPHKSDVGGVITNLMDEHAVRTGYAELLQNVRDVFPQANILGVHVQKMISYGQEVIIGAIQDAQFGPLVMFGSGGVEVEGLKDVTFALAPLNPGEAEEMLEGTWAGRKLKGFRSLPPADRTAALQILRNLSRLAMDFPQFREIEVNPLRVLSEGQGAFAIDVRILLAEL